MWDKEVKEQEEKYNNIIPTFSIYHKMAIRIVCLGLLLLVAIAANQAQANSKDQAKVGMQGLKTFRGNSVSQNICPRIFISGQYSGIWCPAIKWG